MSIRVDEEELRDMIASLSWVSGALNALDETSVGREDGQSIVLSRCTNVISRMIETMSQEIKTQKTVEAIPLMFGGEKK